MNIIRAAGHKASGRLLRLGGAWGDALRYRADVDGLRALAVVVVVAFHVGIPGFSGGFVGVDVFFVISGYLITGLLWGQLRSADRISWADFYARRARRLLPMLAVVTVATLVVGTFVMVPDPELRWLSQSVIAVAASLSNVFFYAKTSSYFGADADLLPLLNTWSLAVEEQFYLVWPPFLAAAWWVVRRHRDRGRALVVGAVVVVAVASFALSVVLATTNQAAAFYWMPPRLWELAAGGLLALGVRRLPALSAMTAAVIAAAGLVLICCSVVLLDPAGAFPGVGALPVVVGTVLVIGAGACAPNPVSLALSVRPAVSIGMLSYSWYLIHWPMLVFARIASMDEQLLRDALIAVGSLGLSALSFRYVEQPFRTARWTILARPRNALLSAAGVLVVLALLGGIVLRDTDSFSQVDLTESVDTALRENRTSNEPCPNRPTGDPEAVDCQFDPQIERSLVLVGDSHALAVLPAARSVARSLGWSLKVLWDVGCPFVVGYQPPSGAVPLTPACASENQVRFAHIVDNRSDIGAVLMTGRATSTVLQSSPELTEEASAAWARALAGTVGGLTAGGTPVFVMQDVPRFERNVPECTLRRSECDIHRLDALQFRAPVADAEVAALSELDLAQVWDPFEALCGSESCRATSGGAVLYRDVDHLSESGAELLAPSLERQVDAFLRRVEQSADG